MNSNKFITGVASAVVGLAVVAGLYLSGSPGEQRLLRLDEQRISDLIQLSGTISSYWDQSARLPPDLAALVDGQRLRSVPTDPQTEVIYAYEIVNMEAYRLCAEFARASVQTTPEDFWAHPAGLHCFDLRVGPDR